MEISQIKSQTNIVDVIGGYISLKKRGSEYYGVCPFHDDQHASLQVNESKQVFKCFACGEGGDVFDFLTAQGKTIAEAKQELSGVKINADAVARRNEVAKSRPNWKQVVPAPSEPTMDFITNKRKEVNGEWVQLRYIAHWAYRDAQGQLIGYAVRFQDTNGEKDVYPLSYCTDGTRSTWRWQGFDTPRPLYNLHLLRQYPNATVLLVEGEKTAEAAQAQFEPAKVVVTTWIGGSNAITKTDWSPLQGRKVIAFPDNDVQGLCAMLHIKAVADLGVMKILPLDTTLPKGWDCADKQWAEGELRAFVLSRMTDEIPANYEVGMWRFKQIAGDTFYIFGMENGQWVFRKEALPELPPPPPPPPLLPEAFTGTPEDLPPAQEEGGHFTDDWFRFMGYEKSESGTQSFYFFVFRSNQLIRLSPTAMNKSNLMLLAPLNWWEQMFPSKGKSKVDTDAAANYLIEQSIEQGIFNPDNIRGRGAWIDGKNTVIHCGSHLIVNGEHLPFNKFKSKYIYEAGYDLGFQFVEPMNATEGKKLLDLCSLMNWDRPINAYFLAGWCVIAPVCGALKWRPHIWITGAAGTGKSWIFEKIVRRLLSGTALSVQSETTEAGIRQYLGQDALPVTFDEAEGEDRKAQDRMQSVLTLMRGASTSDGGMIIKGSAGGSATRYCIRSCFAYASIGVSLNQQSDRSRVTVLSVSKLQGEEGKKRWEQIQRAYHETMTEDYTTRLQSRTVALLPSIIKNAETFASAAAVELGDQRAGDQVGALLAGAYSLISNKQITFDEALAWIKTKDWSDERAHDDNRDEVRLITHLMERVAEGENMEGKRFRRTVGELVSIARGVVDWADMLPEVATKNLLTLGYRLDMNKGTLLVSNTAEFIRSSLKDTPWVNNHLTILRRLKGAQPKDQTTFGSYMKSRAIEIPLVTIFGE